MTEKEISEILAKVILETHKETPKINGEEIRRTSEDVGIAYYYAFLGFKDAGFNDEQAFKLLLHTISKGGLN